MSSDKTTRWGFTAWEDQWCLFEKMPPGIAEWGWQVEEAPTTGKKHYQGYLRTQQQQRDSFVRKLLPGVHVKPAINWNALVNYCKKEETRVDGVPAVHQTNDIPTQYTYAEEVAERIVKQEQYLMSINPNHRKFQSWNLEEALVHIEAVVRNDIASGRRGIQWIASNPNWKVMWKAFWKECLLAAFRPSKKTDRQTDSEINSPDKYTQEDASQEDVRSRTTSSDGEE